MRHSQTGKHTRHFAPQLQEVVLAFWILSALFGTSARASELKPETVAAFDRYITATEARMGEDVRLNQFLVVDRLPDLQRKEAYNQLQRGQAYIEELHTKQDDQPIHIPNGLVHHWVGVMFVPQGTLSETLAILNDYNNEPEIYKPEIRRAKLIEQNGNQSKIYLQFYSKSIVTVVLDAYFDVVEKRIGSVRVQSASRSTRIVEVVDAGGPNEHERTDGNDHGYMWRLDSFWRIEQKDGGVYIQNESITLTRTVPPMLAWLINPLTKSIPRGVLLDMLTDTQKAVQKARTTSNQLGLSQGSAALSVSSRTIATPHP
ncbi:MAG TPA: hypothetical protein VN976_18630 [Verrucomicrobiae bacterium]|nr:hypothetical protein [Verrucomicrobiae bacterium]